MKTTDIRVHVTDGPEYASAQWNQGADFAEIQVSNGGNLQDEQSSTGDIPWPEVAGVAEVAGSPIFARAYVGEKVDQPATSATPATPAACGPPGTAQALIPICELCSEPTPQPDVP